MLEKLVELVKACGCDVTYIENDCIIIEDFDGFDDEGDEIIREYEHPMEVEALEEWLSENGNDYYGEYQFDNFSIVLYYRSEDI